jgi:hypothetical protein
VGSDGEVRAIIVQPPAKHRSYRDRAVCVYGHVQGAVHPDVSSVEEAGSQEPHPLLGDVWDLREGPGVAVVVPPPK